MEKTERQALLKGKTEITAQMVALTNLVKMVAMEEMVNPAVEVMVATAAMVATAPQAKVVMVVMEEILTESTSAVTPTHMARPVP